jgi:hypothetical protein
MLLLLSKFSPSVLSIDVGHALQLSKILSIFIKRKVPRSYPSSASFLGIDPIISVFVSSHMDGLNLSSILNLPSVLDCLPPLVRKFWSPPLVVWKYVKTSGQEFYSYRELGRSQYCFPDSDSLVLLIPILVMLFLLTLISSQDPL